MTSFLIKINRPEAAEDQNGDEESSQRRPVSDAVDQLQGVKVIFLEQNMKYSSVRGRKNQIFGSLLAEGFELNEILW